MESPPPWNGRSAPNVYEGRTSTHPDPWETTVSNRVPNRATSRPLAPIVALLALAALLTGCIYHDGYPAYYGGYGYYGGPAYVAGPGYYGGCYWQRQRFWDGYGWRFRRVRVCG